MPKKKKPTSTNTVEQALAILSEHGYAVVPPREKVKAEEPESVIIQEGSGKEPLSVKKVSGKAVRIFLRARHGINDKTYGPGHVTVTHRVADVLLEQDRRAVEADRRVLEKPSHSYLIKKVRYQGGQEQSVGQPVSLDFFDQEDVLEKPSNYWDTITGG